MTAEMKEFLFGYCPKDDMFTSAEEMQQIEEQLGLKEMDIEGLCYTRDQVVDFYHEKMEERRLEVCRDDKWYDLMTAMQSVTAVVDYAKIQLGRFDRV